ncbi:MAG: hypothetical protein IT207_10785 [Fimbriimonadaceae bacterium]|nr:hypothetical protein [Fimbriimonadaceae bacterium]
MRASFAGLVAVASAIAAPQEQGSSLERWYQENIASRTTVSGNRRLGYHVRKVEGDLDAYDVTEYGGRGLDRFTDFGYVRVTGFKVMGFLNFDVNIQDSRFQDPQANRLSLDYEGGGFTANAGDIRGTLGSTNPHARFERSLTGVSIGYKSSGFEAKVLHSQARGEARTVSFAGTNSAGPYFLQASQVVRGSERIEVDGEPQVQGQDYTVDYELGAVYFVNRQTLQARIIPPTSTIVATYEAFNFGGSSGTIQGVSASYNAGGLGKIGVTALRQKSGSSGASSGRLERFQGFGPPSTPYVLQFEPQSIAGVVIRVDGVLQRLNVDYQFDAANPAVFFMTRFVPSTSTIDVLYTPKQLSNVDGDRSVVGVDYTLPLGKSGRLLVTQTVGELTNTADPRRGTARFADLRYSLGDFEVAAGVRDVPSNFVGIETAGFERNERTADLRLVYRPSATLTYDALYRNSSVASRVGTGSSVRTVANRITRAEGGVSLTPENGMPLRLRHVRTGSRTIQGSTTVDTTTLGTSRNTGAWSLGLDLTHRSAKGPFTFSGQRQNGTVTTRGLELRAGYRGEDRFGATVFAGLNQVSAAGRSGLGRDIGIGASYRASDKLDFRLDVSDSDGGALSALGFDSGLGIGYGGNGFSSGADSSFLNTAGSVTAVNLLASYLPTDRLTLVGSLHASRRQGGLSANTETLGAGLQVGWNLGRSALVDFSLDGTRTKFLGGTVGEASVLTAALGVEGSPPGRFTYRTGLTALLTGGSGEFAQDSLALDAALGYRLAPRHNLMLGLDFGQIRGYLPQNHSSASLTYQYQIWKSLAFNLGYRWIDVRNTTPGFDSGAYRSSGFDFELEFNFGG